MRKRERKERKNAQNSAMTRFNFWRKLSGVEKECIHFHLCVL